MDNRESDLITAATEILAERLPPGWAVKVVEFEKALARDSRVDAFVSIEAPSGESAIVAIEAKTRLTPRDALYARDIARRLDDVPLILVSPFLSAGTRERLGEADLNWLDLTGNIRIVLNQPGLFIENQGEQRRRGSASRPARTLKGRTAGRAVRALLGAPLPIGVRELAERAGIDPGYMSRVLALLDTAALIERESRGPVTQVDRARLVRRWANDAPIESRGKIQTFLEPRGVTTLLERLRKTEVEYVLTGSVAAQQWAPVAPPRFAQLYVRRLANASSTLGIRRADEGANVQVIQPKDEAIIESGERREDGLVYASPVQVVVDLLTSPGRAPAEGEALLEWMTERDDVW